MDDNNDTQRSPRAGYTWRRFSYPPRSVFSRPTSLLSTLMFPLHLFYNVVRFVFGVLRIPIPQLPFASLNFYRSLRPTSGPSDPRSASDRWVRALEEESGAVCFSRARPFAGVASGASVGPSSLAFRSNAQSEAYEMEERRKILPDFTLGSYEEILRICEKEVKVGCVILVSSEHDDVSEFKKTTLTDLNFVKLLCDNDVVVWGGDVREQDAWSAAQKLQATTYPFVAFVAPQPRRDSSSVTSRSVSGSTLTILSRHQGPCLPASGPTSAQTLCEHMERQLLPRVTPYLQRVRTANWEREHDRLLREQQDKAFQDTARRDRERLEAKVAEESRASEEKRQREERERQEEEDERRRAEEVSKLKVLRMDWRRYARRSITPSTATSSIDAIRIAIRLPGNKRIIHQFSPRSSLTSLYSLVDSHFIPDKFATIDDPEAPPEGSATGEQAIERQIQNTKGSPEKWWGFKLALAYPRKEIRWEAGKTLDSVAGLKGGVQLVVEIDEDAKEEDSADSDGYSTDSDQ